MFYTKTVTVEAMQFENESSGYVIQDWIPKSVNLCTDQDEPYIQVFTFPSGIVVADLGDYVVRYPGGNLEVMTDMEFRAAGFISVQPLAPEEQVPVTPDGETPSVTLEVTPSVDSPVIAPAPALEPGAEAPAEAVAADDGGPGSVADSAEVVGEVPAEEQVAPVDLDETAAVGATGGRKSR